jgi:hypothetical protein
MMANDPIPADDDNLLVELDRFLGALDTAPGHAASSISAAELAELRALRDTLADANAEKRRDEAAWKASVQVSKAARASAVKVFRKQRRAAGNALSMTNDLRARAGLPLQK